MLDSNGSKTVSVDKAALEELKACIQIAITGARSRQESDMAEKYIEALRNIECADSHDRVDSLLQRLANDPRYHKRDVDALDEIRMIASNAR